MMAGFGMAFTRAKKKDPIFAQVFLVL
jgi:hypothetical protein